MLGLGYQKLLISTNQEASYKLEDIVFETIGSKKQKRGYSRNHNLLNLLVGTGRFELPTSTVSG